MALLAVAFLVSPATAEEGTAPFRSPVVALVGAALYPVVGPPVADGTLLLEGDTILALGPDLEIPEGARVIDATGKRIYPAFVHPGSVLGLIEIGSVRGTNDTQEQGRFNPELRGEVAFNGDSMLLPPTVAGGVLFVHVVPRGGVLGGTSAVLRLQGWHWQDMTVETPVGMHLRVPPYPSGDDADGREARDDREEILKELEELFDDARAFRAAAARGGDRGDAVPTDLKQKALLPVLDGSLPLFVHAREKRQIEAALDFVRDQEIPRVVLVSGEDAVEFADRLREERIPVILASVLQSPSRRWQAYDSPFTAAARLHEAGVVFAIGDSGSRFEAANSRNLPFHAAMAAAFGLPREVALASVTLRPAQILGIADRFGSLEPGKEASFFVTDGDPLEITTRIEEVWHAGEAVDLETDRQRRLYERYRHRTPLRRAPAGDDSPSP